MGSVDFSWLIGGPQGSGVESGANIFSRACAALGYHVFGKREFYSNIKGEHSYFVVRISDREIRSNVKEFSLMTSFDAETIFRHYDSVSPDGAVIYDSALENVETGRIRTLDAPFLERLHASLESKGKPFTVAGALDVAREGGARLYPVSFKGLLADLADHVGNPKLRSLIRMYNVIAVSLSLGLVRLPHDSLLDAIDGVFAKKAKVAELNRQAATYSYNHATESFGEWGTALHPLEKRPHTMLIQGFQGTALGKMACGCRFQPYYPITPASDESVYMETNEILDTRETRPGSVSVVQTEDEICAIGMTIGGALTGARSSTCTSGPGFALMTEALGWAGINEVPMVLTNYQRSGPSTGLPTRHGQDDLLFSVYAGHGDFPKIVYASGSIEDSFYDTANCFNYADVFQLPVIHLMDKFLASSVVTCPRFDPERITIDRGKLLERVDGPYRRFEMAPDGISPRSRLGLDNGIFWNTGDESDEYGHITEDPVMRTNMMDKRMDRMAMILERIPRDQQAVSFGAAEHTIVSWGSTKGPILDALEMLEAKGIRVGYVQIKLLHPFPADYVASLLGDARIIIDVEANHSAQMGKLFEQNVKRPIDYHILKYTGRGMTSTEICDALVRIVGGSADRREILTYGA